MRRETPPIKSLGYASLIALAGCLATRPAISTQQTPRSAPSVSCHIKVEPKSEFLRLAAIARSNEALKVRYSLTVFQKSETGSSQNYQSGELALSPGFDTILSTITLDRSALGHYEAKLVITWDQGSISCRAPRLSASPI
ncbi:curli-like amyloid fiber formation chaperone CsgH [Methylorubrum aminovorans]